MSSFGCGSWYPPLDAAFVLVPAVVVAVAAAVVVAAVVAVAIDVVVPGEMLRIVFGGPLNVDPDEAEVWLEAMMVHCR